MTEPRLICYTTEAMRHPWPEDCFVQGGSRGVVFKAEGGSYMTAFVEAFPGTFLRGEGATIAEAEDACWARYQVLVACPAAPDHGPFEARGYTNGAGFCTACGGWFSRVLPPTPEDSVSGPSLLGRALSGDGAALGEIVAAMAELVDDAVPDVA